MRPKIKIDWKNVGEKVLEHGLTAFLISQGMSPTLAAEIGNKAKEIYSMVSVSISDSPEDVMDAVMKKTADPLFDSRELSPENRDRLSKEILTWSNVKSWFLNPSNRYQFEDQILSSFREDPGFDADTFDVEDLLDSIDKELNAGIEKDSDALLRMIYLMLRNQQPDTKVFRANRAYADVFTDPLFLHKEKKDTRVTLQNLYVLPDVALAPGLANYDSRSIDFILKTMLEEASRGTIGFEEHNFFIIIEGDAGCGKTTFVSWLNYHYLKNDNVSLQILGNRPLITVRLRDLDRKVLRRNSSLSEAILDYMHLDSLNTLEALFPRAVMILDGFDELCMIEGLERNHEELLYDLSHRRIRGFTYVVTTRPNYINPGINIDSAFIVLSHFDRQKRKKWLENYTSSDLCGEEVDASIRQIILSEEEDDAVSSILGSPMTLYMIAARKGSAKYLDNPWALYHHIFYYELSETEYNRMFPNPDRNYSHSVAKINDLVYRVCEEIAYRLYQKKYQLYYLTLKEVEGIIDQLIGGSDVKNEQRKELVKRCFGLCCYWKINEDRGAVEFLHNNIRDFFLAEKICRVFDELVENASRDLQNDTKSLQFRIAETFCELFRYMPLSDRTADFIMLRSKHYQEKGWNCFSCFEYEKRWAADCFQKIDDLPIATGADPVPGYLEVADRIKSILSCTLRFYRAVYEPWLKKNERIRLGVPRRGPAITEIIITEIIKSALGEFFTDVFPQNTVSDIELEKYEFLSLDILNKYLYRFVCCDCAFRYGVFIKCMFRECSFNAFEITDYSFINAYFYNTLFDGTIKRCSFQDTVSFYNCIFYAGCVIDKVNFSSAMFSNTEFLCDFGEVYFSEAGLVGISFKGKTFQKASFVKAAMTDADLTETVFKVAEFTSAVLRNAKLCGAHLEGADFREADLTGADLRGAVMTGVLLQNTVLPDGTHLEKQEDAVSHLKSLDIPGLVI